MKGCVVDGTFVKGPGVRYFRMLVEATQTVEGCKGSIIVIAKEGENEPRMALENLDVTFTPGSDLETATNKTIYEGRPEALDILAITESGDIIPPTPGFMVPTSIGMKALFSDKAAYFLTVVVTGKGVPTLRAIIRFDWDGNWKTSRVRRVG